MLTNLSKISNIFDRMDHTRSTSMPLSSHYSCYGLPKSSLPWKIMRFCPLVHSEHDRTRICMRLQLPTISTTVMCVVKGDKTLLKHMKQPSLLPSKEDEEVKRRMYLLEETRRKLQTTNKPLELIDMIQRLGIAYHFEDEINLILEAEFLRINNNLSNEDDHNLFTTSLCFRLLRDSGYGVSSDIFWKFTEYKTGKFKESFSDDVLGLWSLYEASFMGTKSEEILQEAMEYSQNCLNRSCLRLSEQLQSEMAQAFELPRHKRMVRLEARQFIERYAKQIDRDLDILELALMDFESVQTQHQAELSEITSWWKQLGLVDKLPFARDRPLECFLWTVGLLPEPKYSICRIELAKSIGILLVIDDIFDTYGKMEELILFTDAIKRWDLDAMKNLPEYMKVCYTALYNTTNEICNKVSKENGWSILPHLKSAWIDVIESFMVEARWFNGADGPSLKEYIENGVSTAGGYMALVHLFFLVGEVVTKENADQLLKKKTYPKIFSTAGTILRLWDDLGTAKEEQERGDLASSIQLFMREHNLATEEEARNHILQEINNLWRDLNKELISQNRKMPLAIVKAALNMARASQVVYKHDEETYFSSVDNYVDALFFKPLIIWPLCGK